MNFFDKKKITDPEVLNCSVYKNSHKSSAFQIDLYPNIFLFSYRFAIINNIFLYLPDNVTDYIGAADHNGITAHLF